MPISEQNKAVSLVVLTRSPKWNVRDFVQGAKSLVKRILGRKRGPDMVNESLFAGLKELNVPYRYNVRSGDIHPGDIVYVNTSIEALRFAVRAKREGKITKLVVGPNMSVLPSDNDGIMTSDEIDLILFPSQWTKDHWVHFEKRLEPKIKLWPAGVDVPELHGGDRTKVLVYVKNPPQGLLEHIVSFLEKNSVSYEVIYYGKYDRNEYFSLLEKSRLAIFLSASESQGLALFEAWAHDVPTLVWNRGYWEVGGETWREEKISAPYLTDECGAFFKDQSDFETAYLTFAEHASQFKPRDYIVRNFTYKKTAEHFIDLITAHH